MPQRGKDKEEKELQVYSQLCLVDGIKNGYIQSWIYPLSYLKKLLIAHVLYDVRIFHQYRIWYRH